MSEKTQFAFSVIKWTAMFFLMTVFMPLVLLYGFSIAMVNLFRFPERRLYPFMDWVFSKKPTDILISLFFVFLAYLAFPDGFLSLVLAMLGLMAFMLSIDELTKINR